MIGCEIVFCNRTLPNPANWLVAKLFFVIEPYQTLQIDWLRNCFLLSNLTKPCKLIGCEIVFCNRTLPNPANWLVAKLFFVIEPYQTLQIDWLRNCFLLSNLTKPCKLIGCEIVFCYRTLPNPANWLVAKLFFVTEPYQTLQIDWLRNCFLLSNLTKPCKLIGCEIVFCYRTLPNPANWLVAKLFFVTEPYQTLQIDWLRNCFLLSNLTKPCKLIGCEIVFCYRTLPNPANWLVAKLFFVTEPYQTLQIDWLRNCFLLSNLTKPCKLIGCEIVFCYRTLPNPANWLVAKLFFVTEPYQTLQIDWLRNCFLLSNLTKPCKLIGCEIVFCYRTLPNPANWLVAKLFFYRTLQTLQIDWLRNCFLLSNLTKPCKLIGCEIVFCYRTLPNPANWLVAKLFFDWLRNCFLVRTLPNPANWLVAKLFFVTEPYQTLQIDWLRNCFLLSNLTKPCKLIGCEIVFCYRTLPNPANWLVAKLFFVIEPYQTLQIDWLRNCFLLPNLTKPCKLIGCEIVFCYRTLPNPANWLVAKLFFVTEPYQTLQIDWLRNCFLLSNLTKPCKLIGCEIVFCNRTLPNPANWLVANLTKPCKIGCVFCYRTLPNPANWLVAKLFFVTEPYQTLQIDWLRNCFLLSNLTKPCKLIGCEIVFCYRTLPNPANWLVAKLFFVTEPYQTLQIDWLRNCFLLSNLTKPCKLIGCEIVFCYRTLPNPANWLVAKLFFVTEPYQTLQIDWLRNCFLLSNLTLQIDWLRKTLPNPANWLVAKLFFVTEPYQTLQIDWLRNCFLYRTLPNPANWLVCFLLSNLTKPCKLIGCEIVFCNRTLPNPANWLVAKLFFVIEPYQTLQIDWLRNCFLLSNLTKPCKLIGCEIVFCNRTLPNPANWLVAKLFFVIEPYQTLQIDWLRNCFL